MRDWQKLAESGILELYVMGETNEADSLMIEGIMASHPEIKKEITEIEIAFEMMALDNAIIPDPIVKPFLLATIDYTDRMKSGEPFVIAPLLADSSKSSDYDEWIERADMKMPEDFDEVHAKILSYTEDLITAIVWIKHMAPQEVHDDEYEKFLILEGTCEIHVAEHVYNLKAGDFLTIPLHQQHHVNVTSEIPCKVILQRVAA